LPIVAKLQIFIDLWEVEKMQLPCGGTAGVKKSFAMLQLVIIRLNFYGDSFEKKVPPKFGWNQKSAYLCNAFEARMGA